MKNRILISILSFNLTLLVFTLGCKKDDIGPAGSLYQIKRYGYVNEEFIYNKNNLISEVNSTSVYRKFYYDQNLRLTREEQAVKHDFYEQDKGKFIDPQKLGISWFILYEYDNNGKLSKESTYNLIASGSYLYSISSFQYNDEGLISKELFQFGNDTVSQIRTFEYDSNGNVSYQEELFSGLIHSRTTFEYDSFKNPYKIFEQTGSPGINTNKNNIIKSKSITNYTFYGRENESEYETHPSYVYDYKSGYPTMIIDGEEYTYY